jgi:hypothetical protein
MQVLDNKCCKKATKPISLDKVSLPIITLFLALLPKCPFCVLAYSSTIVLCSKTHKETINSPTTILLTLVFCTIILFSIILNFKGKRTYYSVLTILSGMSFIFYSVIIDGGEILYYFGIILMFFGIWLNGSFLWFLNKIRNQKSSLESPQLSNSFIQKNSNL